MASPPQVAAVVVTYDALPWIEQCLESLRGVETVVVDNGSRDGTVDLVRERFPEVRVIEALCVGLYPIPGERTPPDVRFVIDHDGVWRLARLGEDGE